MRKIKTSSGLNSVKEGLAATVAEELMLKSRRLHFSSNFVHNDRSEGVPTSAETSKHLSKVSESD